MGTSPISQAMADAAARAPKPAYGDVAADYLAGLNAPQRQAVETLDGPVLVLAGAGTGKTRALTTRLAHLLVTRRAGPHQVLAVTFTNKAAQEMRERVGKILGREVEGWWLGTFHALAVRILRRHGDLVGLSSDFTILDTDDQIRLVKQIMAAEGVDEKKWPARVVLGVFQSWKDRALTPDKLKEGDGGEVAGGHVVALYRQYQARLATLNAADFGDLLLHNLTLFQKHPDILAEYQRRFRYILVDEYQDTNAAQYMWLRLLAREHRNICCVGDDDQSIYGWRGAEVGNILRFEKDFPGAAIIRLEENYRSTGHILAAASGVIAHNQGRLDKELWTGGDSGEKVRVISTWDGDEEARIVGDEVEARQRGGDALADMAVLVRAGHQTRAFEERFLTIGVPCRVIGGPRFYERAEIRDALAYLRVIYQPDDDLAFERIVNVPKRGIGKTTMQKIHTGARARRRPMLETVFHMLEAGALPKAAATALGKLVEAFSRWRRQYQDGMRHSDLARIVLDESGYTAMWQADQSPDAPGRLENLKELVAAMEEFDTLAGFLEHVSLVMETANAANGDMVSIMTLHGAKGLEFDTVFLPGWEEGLFPSQRSMDEKGISGLEEERRLAYVGITRARRRAIILTASSRRLFGQWMNALPSRFIDELPEEHVAMEGMGPASNAFHEPSNAEWNRVEPTGPDTMQRFENAREKAFRTIPDRERFPGYGDPNAPVIEGTTNPYASRRPAKPAGAAAHEFGEGERVFHRKFGYGTVLTVEDDKLEIEFDHAGTKRVMADFIVPEAEAG